MKKSFTEVYRELGEAAGLPPELEPVFRIWYELLVKWNRAINLTRVSTARRAVAYHLADAVPLARALPAGASLLDIGSGPGVPGLVVAVLRSDCMVTLVESSAKKAAFLLQAAAAMKLVNAKTVNERAERLTGFFDVVTARAVGQPEQLAESFGHLVAPAGKLAAFVSAKSPAATPPGWSLVDEIRYSLPADEGPRRLLLFSQDKNE